MAADAGLKPTNTESKSVVLSITLIRNILISYLSYSKYY